MVVFMNPWHRTCSFKSRNKEVILGKVLLKGVDFKNKTQWCIVASRTSAIIYKRTGKRLSIVDLLLNKDGRSHERDLVSDRPGRSYSVRGRGTLRHAFGKGPVHHEKVA